MINLEGDGDCVAVREIAVMPLKLTRSLMGVFYTISSPATCQVIQCLRHLNPSKAHLTLRARVWQDMPIATVFSLEREASKLNPGNATSVNEAHYPF